MIYISFSHDRGVGYQAFQRLIIAHHLLDAWELPLCLIKEGVKHECACLLHVSETSSLMEMLKSFPCKLRSEGNVPHARKVRQDCPEDAEDEANEGFNLDVQGYLE